MITKIGSGLYLPAFDAGSQWEPPEAIGDFQWMRVGNVITVAGHMRFSWNYYGDPNVPGWTPSADPIVSLPQPTVFPASWKAAGSCAVLADLTQLGRCWPVSANSGASGCIISLTAPAAFTPYEYALHFTYAVSP